ncbi:FAD-dependent monooxygenase [Rhodococcus wratislaviensis]|uniref:FAD-dependent monooxygenase n=1 Tax=Rhodococcus wratislaviensis TaxID=44752 RepID=UPI00366365A2
MNREEHADDTVLIVGGGPVGMLTALLLARHGLSSTVLERRPRLGDAPRAHVLNPRSLEICHAAGLDVDEMRRRATRQPDDQIARFVPHLLDHDIATLPFEVQDKTHTPFPRMNLRQPLFESYLAEFVDREPLIDVRRGHRWIEAAEDAATIRSTIATGDVDGDGKYSFTSRYLLGADGANSAVREAYSIPMRGQQEGRRCLTISFKANWREELCDRPAMFYWALSARTPGVFLAHDIASTWTFLAHDVPESTPDVDSAREIVLDAVGARLPLEITHVIPWLLIAQVADRYQQGRVFLLGDAAHRFPPTGGLGMNTGIQDSHNLVWKLAAVEAGWAETKLLNTYERERQPVAEVNARQSLTNAENLLELLSLDEYASRQAIEHAIDRTYDAFNSIGLQLGFSYGDNAAPPTVRTLEPTARIGDRMPHAWIEKQIGSRTSTLDLLDPLTFTLLTGNPGRWTDLEIDSAAPFRVVDLNTAGHFPDTWLQLTGLNDMDNALLVRPDGHIAARLTPADCNVHPSTELHLDQKAQT